MTDMNRLLNVYEAFSNVMGDVRAIEKSDRNTQQGFTFRGIDAVMQAVGPVLRKHNVTIIPTAEELRSETYTTSKGTSMRNVTVTMRYTVFGPGGDYFTGTVYGEAADSGDKAVTKAQSVAYRTFLLQALTVPTGDTDPDAESHERVAQRPKSPADIARDKLAQLVKRHKLDGKAIGARFADDYATSIYDADEQTIVAFTQVIADEVTDARP